LLFLFLKKKLFYVAIIVSAHQVWACCWFSFR